MLRPGSFIKPCLPSPSQDAAFRPRLRDRGGYLAGSLSAVTACRLSLLAALPRRLRLERCLVYRLDGGSLGILKADLKQRKRESDRRYNDDKGHKFPIGCPGSFFALRQSVGSMTSRQCSPFAVRSVWQSH